MTHNPLLDNWWNSDRAHGFSWRTMDNGSMDHCNCFSSRYSTVDHAECHSPPSPRRTLGGWKGCRSKADDMLGSFQRDSMCTQWQAASGLDHTVGHSVDAWRGWLFPETA